MNDTGTERSNGRNSNHDLRWDDAGQVMPSKWIINEILSRHCDVFGSDKDFYLLCAREHVKDTVSAVLRSFKETEEPQESKQLVLEGYEHLQKAYLVERDKQSTVVPIRFCSDEELHDKEALYRHMGEGCLKHADEIRRYRLSR